MTAVLIWKEYRQQRPVWLAILVLSVLLIVSLGAAFGDGTGLEVFGDRKLRAGLVITVLCMTITFGVISGAMLLAGEDEEGTQVYLDSLTGRRRPLWVSKCIAGACLTLYLSAVMGVVSLALGFGNWKTTFALPLVGLDALIWGLLGGALCRTVLKAVLVGIFFMIQSWALSVITITSWDMDWWKLGLYKLVPATAALFVSERI